MGLGVNMLEVLIFALGLITLYVIGWLLLVPFKLLFKAVCSSLLGAAVLLLINIFGGFFSVTIAINPLSAFITGYFGLPGIILLLIIKLIIP
ncbi:MAG: pro-sigmaK processing inhibitor BofA family protein [Christensenellales bacterium]